VTEREAAAPAADDAANGAAAAATTASANAPKGSGQGGGNQQFDDVGLATVPKPLDKYGGGGDGGDGGGGGGDGGDVGGSWRRRRERPRMADPWQSDRWRTARTRRQVEARQEEERASALAAASPATPLSPEQLAEVEAALVELLSTVQGSRLAPRRQAWSARLERGLAMFRSVQDVCRPETANVVLSVLVRAGREQDVMDLLRLLRRRGIEVDVANYTSMVSRFSKAGNLRLATSLFRELAQRHVPELPMITALLSGLFDAKMFDEASKLYAEAVEGKGLVPDVQLHNVMLKGLRLASKGEQFDALSQRLLADGAVSEVTFVEMTQMELQRRRPRGVLDLWRVALKNYPALLTSRLVTVGASGLCKLGHPVLAWNEVQRVVGLERPVSPEPVLFYTLIFDFVRGERVDLVRSVWTALPRFKIAPNQRMVERYVMALTHLGYARDAAGELLKLAAQGSSVEATRSMASNFVSLLRESDAAGDKAALEALERFVSTLPVTRFERSFAANSQALRTRVHPYFLEEPPLEPEAAQHLFDLLRALEPTLLNTGQSLGIKPLKLWFTKGAA
jgi:pentatricopeptide repeat protein